MKQVFTFCLAVLVSYSQGAYYGKLLHSGWGDSPTHGLTGDTYGVDEGTIQIIGFSYDGTAPGAVFYLGTEKPYATAKAAKVDPTATTIDNPQGNKQALEAYSNEDIVLTLPEGTVLTDYTYISVWCRNVTMFFGGFDIPSGFVSPKSQVIGKFKQLAHQVASGDITVVDDKTVRIEDFTYDGQGPDVYFYVGATDDVTAQSAPYGKIPDESGSSDVIGRYVDKTITLTLPGSLSFSDLKWLSVWCVRFAEDFGHVIIPGDLNVPPSGVPRREESTTVSGPTTDAANALLLSAALLWTVLTFHYM